MPAARIVLLTAVVSVMILAARTAPAQQTAVSIQRAVQEGKVEVQVSSLGGATGNSVRVDVRRKVPHQVHVEINAGSVFVSQSGTVQNMAGGVVKGEFTDENTYQPAETNVIVLADDKWHGYLIESFCMDFHKGPPQRGERFSLVIQDQRTVRIMQQAVKVKAPLWAVQFALWMDREGIPENQLLGQYGNYATEVDVRVARELIQKAEQVGVATVPANMPANVSVQVKKLFSPDPTVRAAAVKVLVGMGKHAETAAPFLADNVATTTPGQLTRSTWVNILTNPAGTNVSVGQTGLPDFKALAEALRERRDARREETGAKPKDKTNGDRRHPLRDLIREQRQKNGN
jgi:hypothetical protein